MQWASPPTFAVLELAAVPGWLTYAGISTPSTFRGFSSHSLFSVPEEFSVLVHAFMMLDDARC